MILDGINYSEELERVSHLSIQRTVEYFQEFRPSKGFLVGRSYIDFFVMVLMMNLRHESRS